MASLFYIAVRILPAQVLIKLGQIPHIRHEYKWIYNYKVTGYLASIINDNLLQLYYYDRFLRLEYGNLVYSDAASLDTISYPFFRKPFR